MDNPPDAALGALIDGPGELIGMAFCLGVSAWFSFNAMFRDRVGFTRSVGYLFDAKSREALRERGDLKIGGLLRLGSWIVVTVFGAIAGWLILQSLGIFAIFMPT